MKFKFNNSADSREDYVLLDDPNLAQKNPELGEVVRLILDHSRLGRKLLAESSAVRVYTNALTGYLGQATSCWKTELSDRNSVLENVVILSHELKHNNEYQSVGKANTESRPNKRRKKWKFLPDRHVDCISLLRRSLYSEAGAETCAIRVAFEMKLNGFDQVFINSAFVNDPSAKKAKYAPLYRLFDASYRETCSATEIDESALIRAGTNVFAAYVQQPALVSAYGMLVLEECIDRIAHRVLREYPVLKFKKDEGMTYARIADEYLATEARHPASNDQLFRDNKLLGQAFDYLAARQVLDVRPAHDNLAKDKAVQRSISFARSTICHHLLGTAAARFHPYEHIGQKWEPNF